MPVSDPAHLAALQAAHRERNFIRLMAYLADHPCVDCGEADPIVLDFDHLPGATKRFEVGRAVGSSTRSWSLISSEIERCDVVCANCHRRRTARRAGHRRASFLGGRESPRRDSNPRPGG
jgi:hypothetical protein